MVHAAHQNGDARRQLRSRGSSPTSNFQHRSTSARPAISAHHPRAIWNLATARCPNIVFVLSTITRSRSRRLGGGENLRVVRIRRVSDRALPGSRCIRLVCRGRAAGDGIPSRQERSPQPSATAPGPANRGSPPTRCHRCSGDRHVDPFFMHFKRVRPLLGD